MKTLGTLKSGLGRWSGAALLAVVVVFPVVTAQAGEEMLKGKLISENVKIDWTKDGELDDRLLGSQESTSETKLENGETVTFTDKGRTFQDANVEWTLVDDVPGHVIGSYEYDGETTLENGEVATFENMGTFEWIKGAGPFQGLMTSTYEDGSTVTTRYEGTTERVGKVRIEEGTYTYVDGTGRFAGVEGEGEFTSTHFNKMSITDWDGSRTFPDQ
jgi:hypothetical protein